MSLLPLSLRPTAKNVAAEIAYQLCDSVAKKLEGKVMGTFTSEYPRAPPTFFNFFHFVPMRCSPSTPSPLLLFERQSPCWKSNVITVMSSPPTSSVIIEVNWLKEDLPLSFSYTGCNLPCCSDHNVVLVGTHIVDKWLTIELTCVVCVCVCSGGLDSQGGPAGLPGADPAAQAEGGHSERRHGGPEPAAAFRRDFLRRQRRRKVHQPGQGEPPLDVWNWIVWLSSMCRYTSAPVQLL